MATRNKITVTSPVIVMESSFGDVLRGSLNPATGLYGGPVPTMTTEPVNLGLFQLAMKAKTMTRPPLSSGNSEG
jgi:hypothetical protein